MAASMLPCSNERSGANCNFTAPIEAVKQLHEVCVQKRVDKNKHLANAIRMPHSSPIGVCALLFPLWRQKAIDRRAPNVAAAPKTSEKHLPSLARKTVTIDSGTS